VEHLSGPILTLETQYRVQRVRYLVVASSSRVLMTFSKQKRTDQSGEFFHRGFGILLFLQRRDSSHGCLESLEERHLLRQLGRRILRKEFCKNPAKFREIENIEQRDGRIDDEVKPTVSGVKNRIEILKRLPRGRKRFEVPEWLTEQSWREDFRLTTPASFS